LLFAYFTESTSALKLSGSFMAYYVPDLALAANMLLMAVVLIFKPQGLFGAKG